MPSAQTIKRVELILRSFKVNTTQLNREEQYKLAIGKMEKKAGRWGKVAYLLSGVTVAAIGLTVIAFLNTDPTLDPSPLVSENLRVKIEGVEVVKEQNGAQAFIRLSIENMGPPTSLNQFAIRINHVSSRSIQYNGPPEQIDGTYTISPSSKGGEIVIQPQDSILNTTQKAIGKDQNVSGWLRRGLPISEDVLRQPGLRYTVSFIDATKQRYQADYEMQ